MKELTIEHRKGKGRTARVWIHYRADDGTQPVEKEIAFKFAMTDEQRRLIQWYLEEYLVYPWGEFRTRARDAEEALRQVGVELFNAVFADRGTAVLYHRVADDLAQTRFVIRTNTPAGIALPWELLRDPQRGEYGDLARRAHCFLRAHTDLNFSPPPPIAGDTFNILMVISRPEGPEKDVPFQSVSRRLLELIRSHRDRIRLDILRPQTFEQLGRVLNDRPGFYHVLHFDGHGAFHRGRQSAGFYGAEGAQGRVIFENETGGQREVTGQELGGLLAGKGVPIVLLNSCQSGMTHPEALYPSVADQILQAGVAGVVAMAYSVHVDAAVRFMGRLYEALIHGEELARAVAVAREALWASPQRPSPLGPIPLQDWIVPVHFEAASSRPMSRPLQDLHLDSDLLQDQQATSGREIDCPDPPVHGFVGRDGPILELERAFQTDTIVLLEGMAGVRCWDRATCAAAGSRMRFRSFRRTEPRRHRPGPDPPQEPPHARDPGP